MLFPGPDSIIIPPAKKDKFIGILVVISMLASFVFTKLPGLREISSGFRIIILTLVIAGVAAVVHPIRNPINEEKVGGETQ